MSEQLARAAAADRAAAARLRTFALATGSRYLVKSQSQPGAYHVVTSSASGALSCDCQGFYYRRVCTHTATVERRIARDRAAAARAERSRSSRGAA